MNGSLSSPVASAEEFPGPPGPAQKPQPGRQYPLAGLLYHFNSSLTTLPGGERGQTVFLPFTKQICMAYLNVSDVYFSPG